MSTNWQAFGGIQYAVILTGHVTHINSKINKQIPALTLMVYCKRQISAKLTTNIPLVPQIAKEFFLFFF